MIRGFFPAHRGPHPYLTVAVYLPGVREEWTLIDFLVDTGAASTSIHPGDALRRLGVAPGSLDAASWAREETVGGQGCTARHQRFRLSR